MDGDPLEVARGLVRRVVGGTNIFTELERQFNELGVTGKVSTLKESKRSVNGRRGLLFEVLVAELIRLGAFRTIDAAEVILYKNLTAEQRQTFQFPAADMGIDLVVRTTAGEWLAVQCKYRKAPRPGAKTPQGRPIRHVVPWAELSTFYALAERTGPTPTGWAKFVVITNAESIRHQGRKTKRDLSICRGSFNGIDRAVWLALSGDPGRTLSDPEPEPATETLSEPQPSAPDPDEIRRKRLQFFGH